MQVKLLAHTQLSDEFYEELWEGDAVKLLVDGVTDGQVVAFTAIRTCYSHLKPSEVFIEEGEKYFKSRAKDGGEGSDGDRLIRHIMNSGHTSTVEHLHFTFSVEGLSRVALSQLTRHRVGYSYSVQSQRYVKFGSDDKSGGFDYVIPKSVTSSVKDIGLSGVEGTVALDVYKQFMRDVQIVYDKLRKAGVSAEDARMVLPNAATCNLIMSCNLRSALEFYRKRGSHTHAQWEIKQLAEKIREKIEQVEPWTAPFFEQVKAYG